MKILLVDDDIPTLEVIRDSIRWEAYGIHTVHTAYNISDAEKLIEEHSPEVVMCDIEMPRGSGIDLLKWVREKGYKSEFIFLTCHESFGFASTAINYNAVAYITKPFNKSIVEAALSKTADVVAKKAQLQEYSTYGKYWMDSKAVVEQGFWHDILLSNIPPRVDLIASELQKRHLKQDLLHDYYLVLSCIGKSQVDDAKWDDNTFKYAFSNLTSEVILDELNGIRVFSYIRNGSFYNAAIIHGDLQMGELQAKCQKLINACETYLYCTATCYIGKKVGVENLAVSREELEDLDRNNLLSRGSVVFQKDLPRKDSNEQYALNADVFNKLLTAGEKVQIVNTLKREVEMLAAQKRLDTTTMHSIRQDFMQIIYSFLYKNEIQAHKLYSDRTSQRLFQASEDTVFDMMKWASFITDKTVDHIKEVQKSEGVVEKAKRFIQQNYTRDIGRDEVALHVFLTPDYLSKIFKAETGTHIKDYINELRIEKAKELLIQGDSSISEIASAIGFDSFSYFSTVFKKAVGETPYTFRKAHRE